MKEFLRNGFEIRDFTLPPSVIVHLRTENWNALDTEMGQLLSPQAPLFELLKEYKEFNSIEHIVAIRKSPDDEGIWHDDGSRKLAFSLSLTEFPSQVEGGQLYFREKGSEQTTEITPQPLGKIIVFKTGQEGYEHKVGAVTKGQRIICAGWCT